MSQNTEQIESKLCAYIDGELDAAGRDEIERHLAANPEHRQLIAELTQTRDVLRSLPRAPAPAELAEALAGQMERSALLDGALLEDAPTSVQLNRWPQMMALAAILVMTVGLGVVVYFVISPTMMVAHQPDLGPPKLGVMPGVPGEADESREVVLKDSVDAARGRPEMASKAGSAPPVAATPTPPPAMAPVSEKPRDAKDDVFAAKGGTHETAGKIGAGATALFTAASAQQQERRRAGESLQQRQSAIFLVVNTDNLALTNSEATNFLKSNGYKFEQVDEPMPAPVSIDVADRALASRLNSRQRVQLRGATDLEMQKKGGDQNRVAVATTGVQQQQQPAAGSGQISALEQKPKETEQSDWTVPSNPDLDKIAAAAAAPNAAKATGDRAPADAQQVTNAAPNGQAEGAAQQDGGQQQHEQHAVAVASPTQLAVVVKVPHDVAGQTIDNMYVVRGMTKQKAEELSQCLVSAGEQQTQVEQKADNIAQVQEQQRMQYGVNATVRLVEALAEAASEPDETADRLPPAVSSIVGRYFDLGVEMPRLDGIVHQEVPQKLEDQDNGVAAMSAPATQPSDGHAQAAVPTSDQQMDVVIMVQSNTLTAPAAPATQPAPANAAEIRAK